MVDQVRQNTLSKDSSGVKDPVMGSSSAAGWVGADRLFPALPSSPIRDIEKLTAPAISSSANLCPRVLCEQRLL